MEKPVASASFLKSLSTAEFARVSQLLDEALDVSAEERLAWLAKIERADPKTAGIIRTLLDLQSSSSQQALLQGNVVADLIGPVADSDSVLVGKHFGPYRVLSLLGHDGMGSVWLAERVDGLFARQVALKLIHPSLMGKVMTERATREREILASLNHPHIARLIDAGFSDDAQPYLALEYVAGSSIIEYCDKHRLPLRSRLALFRQVLSAVQYAHAHLVIHRDLKPSNVLVTQDGQVYGHVSRVLDGHEAHVTSAAYSYDGARIVSSSNDQSVRIWDAATGQQVKTLRLADAINTAAFSPDGQLIVTASYDPIARIWDASAAPIDTQVAWAAAAQFDPLPNAERRQLGLQPPADVRRWANQTECDKSAASPYDPDRRAPGHPLDDIVADIAVAACANSQRDRSSDRGRRLYQHGRALTGSGKFSFARQDFEQAVSLGSRAARIDLASLLAQHSSGTFDLPRAIQLYDQAWQQGVPFAGFALGRLYEYGVNRSENKTQLPLTPDTARAGLGISRLPTPASRMPWHAARLARKVPRCRRSPKKRARTGSPRSSTTQRPPNGRGARTGRTPYGEIGAIDALRSRGCWPAKA